MRSRFLICGAGVLVAMGVVTTQVRDSQTTSDSGIIRRLVIDEKTVQVVRSTYESGAHEPPPGLHSCDVVIVPLTEGGMRVEISGKTVAWKVGEPICIPRGIKHSLVNEGKTAVDLIGIRIP